MVTMQKTQPAQMWRNFSLRGISLDDDASSGSGVASGAGRNVKSWIMLMPEGKYEHPTYGELNFTAAKLAEFKRNFDRRTRKIDIAFDEDHNAGKATGWLERVELRPKMADAPAGLWGLVAWTPLGQQLLSDRIYGYFSPEFGDFQDEETGETFSNVIIGGALTNRPYLKVMPAVKLAEITLAEGVSTKSWASVNKSKLPRSSFLVQGDPDDKSTWKLPIYEGTGPTDADGHYTKRGALNINAVRAALAAIGGARSGTPMSVPGSVKTKLQNLLKRYGGGGGGADSSKSAREDGGGMAKTYRLMSGTAGPKSPIPDGDDEPDYGQETAKMSARKKAADVQPLPSPTDDEDSERFADADSAGDDETMDDMSSDDDGFDSDSNTHGQMTTDGHLHGKYGSHSHDGDADHSDAPMKASSKKASSRKASEERTGSELREMTRQNAELIALREELRTVKYKLYEEEVGKVLDGWQANVFQFSEGNTKKAGRITTSKVFDDAYRAYMLAEGVRLSENSRKKLNNLIEKALSTGIVDLTQRGTSFDQEARRTIHKGGERGATFDEEVALEDEAERIALSEFHKPLGKLDFATQLEVRVQAEKATGYGQRRA